jgi:hypothetical protein
MDDSTLQKLLAQTKTALAARDWPTVANLWQPWVAAGDTEAAYQLAYHYLHCTPCDDDAEAERMMQFMRHAAAQNHPDAIWFLTRRSLEYHENTPQFASELLRAGELGSVHAQRSLGVCYETGNWAGPLDLTEAARWYRKAAERGHAECQYDLGLMLLLGEGEPVDTVEGLMWLERAARQDDHGALQLLVDCYTNASFGGQPDVEKAAYWKAQLDDYYRRNPYRQYTTPAGITIDDLDVIWELPGIRGGSFLDQQSHLSLRYEPAEITPGELDARVAAAIPGTVPESTAASPHATPQTPSHPPDPPPLHSHPDQT